MKNVSQQDMYEFVDDGVRKSIYTILNESHPFLKRDFSLESLINHIPDIEFVNSGKIFIEDYKIRVVKFSELLLKKTSAEKGEEESLVSGDEVNRIFEELKEAAEEIPEAKSFTTIKELVEHAQKNMDDPKTRGLRDAIVKNAVVFLTPEEKYEHKERVLSLFYISQAENRIKAQNPKRREPGQIPEWDRIQAIKRIISKKDSLKRYDEFYDRVTLAIREAALKAMEKARVETTCEMKRSEYVKAALVPTMKCASKDEDAQTEALFEKLKRQPKKEENSWSCQLLEKPELLCDLQAEYSENGIENQRVVAFRYGRFQYTKTQDIAGVFSIDNTEVMPELVGISRIGKDRTKTYFVLMPPIDRIVYRSVDDKTVEPGDRRINFTATKNVEVPTFFGKTKVERQTVPTNVVDGKTGKRLNVFRNKEIPEELEEFFAKVYFSDEYLSSIIKHNASYLGSVEQGKDGPVIHPTDELKLDLAAAHYAAHFPGRVGKVMVKDLPSFCSSSELEIRQYNLINEREKALREKTKEAANKKDEGQGLED